MFGSRETAVLDCPDVGRDGALDVAAAGHEVAHEARRLARIDREHIVQNEYLATAPGPGTDADGRRRDLRGELGSQRRGDHFKHEQIDAGCSQSLRILAHRARRRVGLALRLVAAESVHGLRLEPEVAAY